MERVEIEPLACCAPAGIGLHMTHWSTRSLARIAVARGIVPSLVHSTISLILRSASLPPHRSRYWKTPTLNDEFRERAARILWLYERVEWLYEHDEVILALDEKPNLLVLERCAPTRAARGPARLNAENLSTSDMGQSTFWWHWLCIVAKCAAGVCRPMTATIYAVRYPSYFTRIATPDAFT